MRIYDNQLLTAGDLSQATLTSETTELDSMFGFAVQCNFSGSAVGTVALQGSNDPVLEQQKSQVTNWTTIVTEPLAAPGSIMFNVEPAMYKWLRCVYTRTSGSGSMTINFHAKGV